MGENLNDKEALVARILQLEHERDELRKDIEQLCMQNAGPSYLAVATRMHFQRTAGLEQEIENLKKKLAACIRENVNLQEELSEAYRVKTQLADLHSAEVLKSMEVEKQAKFFQGCVADAFAERDHSVMEAEKAKEKEESVLQQLDGFQRRIEELTSDCLEEQKLSATLRIGLEKQEKENEIFKKTALEKEVDALRKSLDNLQNKLQMGMEIEHHLKKKVYNLENEKIRLEEKMKKGISDLLQHYYQHRVDIKNLIDEGYSHLKSTIDVVHNTIKQLQINGELNIIHPRIDTKLQESECRDVHITSDAISDLVTRTNASGLPTTFTVESGDNFEVLAQALQEKVAALLLLSQQEERYLLESNVNAALQKKLQEFQINLVQVTNEKVKALMELAQLKQEHQLLQEKVSLEMKQGKDLTDSEETSIVQDRDGRLKNMLKKTYLGRWINPLDSNASEAEARLDYEEKVSNKRSNYKMDFARMKIENAALKESLESMWHLTSSVHRLRRSLEKVKESVISDNTCIRQSEELENIVSEAKLLKTALGSSLPASWSNKGDVLSGKEVDEDIVLSGDSSRQKVDSVSAAGFQMAELLTFAAELLMYRPT